MAALTEVVGEEIRQALQSTPPPQSTSATTYDVPAPHVMAYADALRRPSPYGPQHFRPSTASRQQRFTSSAAGINPEQPARKAVIWRTPDNRPLCYHCGEAGHVRLYWPYGRMVMRGFSPDAPRPRYGERPPEIQEYLASHLLPPPQQQRQSRSPSPQRFMSPRRPISTTTTAEAGARSRSPRRGN